LRLLRLLPALGLALLMSATSVRTAGLNLASDKCRSEGGVIAKAFDCGSNPDYVDIVGSFIPTQPHPRFVAFEAKLEVQSQTRTLPAWWQYFNSGSCRGTAFELVFNFRDLPKSSCDDPFEGAAFGGLGFYATPDHPSSTYQGGPNTARGLMGAALAHSKNLQPGTEYYAFRLRLQYQSSTGGGACEGCSTPVCLTLSEMSVYDESAEPLTDHHSHPPAPEVISRPVRNSRISWQDNGNNCQPAVKHRTWGQLTSPYR
jgi:hypothetical protein